MALLIDRAAAGCLSLIDHKHTLLGPFAGLRELDVRPALHENVGEHLVTAGLRTVVHAESGGRETSIRGSRWGAEAGLSRHTAAWASFLREQRPARPGKSSQARPDREFSSFEASPCEWQLSL